MIRTLHIFDLFRHGRAERALRNDLFVLIKAFAPQLIADEERHATATPQPRLHMRWVATSGNPGLRMPWTTGPEEVGQP
jgi:hypothetical protein